MTMNPFEAALPKTSQAESPFVAGNILRDATKEAAESIFDQATDMVTAAISVKSQAQMARKTGNVRWMRKIQSYATELMNLALKFIGQAIVIAAAKFALELCAQAINAVMDFLVKSGGGKVEITTPNVHYVTPGATPPTTGTTGNTRSNEYPNPFSSVSFSGASPW